MRCVGIGVELDVQCVRWRLTACIVKLSIGVAERAGVSLGTGIEAGIELKIIQIGCNRTGNAVVENNSVGEDCMADAEVEDGGAAAGVAALECWDVGDAILIDIDLGDRVVDADAVEVPLGPEDRNYADACLRMLYLKKGRSAMGSGSVDFEAVEIDAEGREMEIEVLEMHAGIQRFGGLVLYLTEQVGMSAGTVEQEHRDDEAKNDREDNDCADKFRDGEKSMTRGIRWPLLVSVGRMMKESHGKLLECLTDADEILRRLHSGHRIEIVSEIDANGADRRGIAQTDAYVIGVERSEIVKADGREDVAAIIERDDTETLLDGQGDAGFCIDDELLVAAARHIDLRAVWGGLI